MKSVNKCLKNKNKKYSSNFKPRTYLHLPGFGTILEILAHDYPYRLERLNQTLNGIGNEIIGIIYYGACNGTRTDLRSVLE